MIAISMLTGAVAGLIHVVSGPDHLAAVAPLTIERGRSAWRLGLRWGFGHAAGVVGVGLASLGLRDLLPLEHLSFWAERLVGLVLIAIGLWGLRRVLIHRAHWHAHRHGDVVHAHFHTHAADTAHHPLEPGHPESPADGALLSGSHRHAHAALWIGVLHGLAGSSHFFGVLPALAFPTHAQAVGYLAAFGLGTVAAMVGFSSVLGGLMGRPSFNTLKAHAVMMAACSVAAVVIGGYWLMV